MPARLILVETLLTDEPEFELDVYEQMQEMEEQRAARATKYARRRPFAHERMWMD